MEQFRALKSAYENIEKTQFYVDEFWNSQVTSFFSDSGLGIYLSTVEVKKELDLNIEENNNFVSLLGIMNGYQQALLFSRQDLEKALKETLLLIKETIKSDEKI